MKIIIVGCGKVGLNLTAQLNQEGHNITVIDIDGDKVRRASTVYDVMGIEGNGTSYQTLSQADIEHTDILIAVTHSDEVNLLCCVIAKKANCRTVARVRNPIYSEEYSIIQEKLGIALIINPEKSAATDIKQLIQYPTAIEVDEFIDGKLELIRFRVTEESVLNGVQLKDSGIRKSGILVCVAERAGQSFVPDGFFKVQTGDILSALIVAETAKKELQRIGVTTGKAKNVAVVGGGGMAIYLAKLLIGAGIRVKLIEHEKERCEELSDRIPEATVIFGDGISQELYREEHLDQADALVAATDIDEENIVFSLFAKKNSVSRIITKVSHMGYAEITDMMQLDGLINPLDIAADHIIRFVRGIERTDSSAVESLYRLNGGNAEAIGFRLSAQSALFGKSLQELKIKKNTIIAAVVRDGEIKIPGGSDHLAAGDSVIIVTTNRGYRIIDDIIER